MDSGKQNGPCTIGVTVKQGEKTLGHSEGSTKITPPPQKPL